jgi:iron complex transport system substrate-binding protein
MGRTCQQTLTIAACQGKAVHRIVSLLPSATEIVCALGFQEQLVGRSHECDYPPCVDRLPVVTRPKFDPEGSSAAIDQRVREILAEALSVYRVEVDVLRQLKPDIIVTQSQCEVCAVSVRDVEDAAAAWLDGPPPKIISLAPYSLSDVLADIERVGIELDAHDRSARLVDALRGRMHAVEKLAVATTRRPTVACIEWLDPLMIAANWVPELVAMAGGKMLFGQPGYRSSKIEFAQLLQADPDVIVLMPCGFDMDRTARELGALSRRPGWERLKAVDYEQIYLTDGNQYFNRPGPRIVESLEILSEILHPELFNFGHAGRAWRRVRSHPESIRLSQVENKRCS